MIRNEMTIDVARPVDEVFQFVDDDAKVKQWISGLVESRRTTPGEPRVGTRFEQIVEVGGRRLAMQGELVAYEPSRRLAVRLTSSLCEMTVEYVFEAVNGGTRMRYLCTSHYHGVFYRLLSGVIRRITQRKVAADFRKLKTLLEVAALGRP